MIVRPTNRGRIIDLTRPLIAKALTACMVLALCGCKTSAGAYPPAVDIAAIIEAKPKPPAEILTDPAANDRYNSAIEARGDRLYAAGARLCRFFVHTGMPSIKCPAP